MFRMNQNKLNGFLREGTQELIIKTSGLGLFPSTATDKSHQSMSLSSPYNSTRNTEHSFYG